MRNDGNISEIAIECVISIGEKIVFKNIKDIRLKDIRRAIRTQSNIYDGVFLRK